jgi:hypothetical protein
MNIFLEDVFVEEGGEDILKPAIRNESLYEVRNDNGATKRIAIPVRGL